MPYLFNGKELDEETGFYYYGARYYDARASIWESVDPSGERSPGWSPYNYTFNNPIILVDPDGRWPDLPSMGDVVSFVTGAANAIVTNHHPTQAGRGLGRSSASSQASYDQGQRAGDVVSMIIGAAEVYIGGTGAVAGVIAAPETAGLSLVLTAEGVVIATEGVIVLNNASKSLLKSESTPPDNNPGTRRKNRLPDKGEPNTVAKNKPGTTAKKYGKDGNVQKEFNKGHQGENVPKNEQNDHIHDYKPNPNNPNGRGDRQPGRPPKKNELKKDFDL